MALMARGLSRKSGESRRDRYASYYKELGEVNSALADDVQRSRLKKLQSRVKSNGDDPIIKFRSNSSGFEMTYSDKVYSPRMMEDLVERVYD